MFSSSESGWIELSLQMKAYIVMYNASGVTKGIDVSAMTGNDKRNTESLYYLLCLTCKGAAQTVLRCTPPGNGPAAWRQLHIRYGQKDMMSSMSMLQALLVFSFGSSVDQVPDRRAEFEALTMRYEADPNVDALSGAIKKAVLVRGCPEPLEKYVQMNLQTYQSYSSIRNAVQSYTEAKRTWRSEAAQASSSTDMEVDPVSKDGYKRKSKGGDGKVMSATSVAKTVGTKTQKETKERTRTRTGTQEVSQEVSQSSNNSQIVANFTSDWILTVTWADNWEKIHESEVEATCLKFVTYRKVVAPPQGRNRASRLRDIQQILGHRLLFRRLRALHDKLCFRDTDVTAALKTSPSRGVVL